jgi:hypothetical protein
VITRNRQVGQHSLYVAPKLVVVVVVVVVVLRIARFMFCFAVFYTSPHPFGRHFCSI